nr:DNA cytosine methyltransferase [uncultured Gemmiger sp.]
MRLFRIRNNQNLSQIGNRAGLAGEKSSLFFHAIRIIREMREATNGIFPAIAVWENVMGAFFSNDRMDFRAVLSSFTAADISMPASGRWAGAGMVRGHTPDLAWRLMDAQHWASPRLARRQRVFVVADFGGRRSHEILFKPRAVQSISASGGDCWLSAACGDRGSFIEAGRRVPITRPFQCYRMRASAKERTAEAFRNSFGLPTDPFPTLLASTVSPFAFWYEDDPAGGCVRFPTERECERLMGLPEGWTRYGADGEEILPAHRYRALGNAIALPCAEYIMRGIYDVLTRRC